MESLTQECEKLLQLAVNCNTQPLESIRQVILKIENENVEVHPLVEDLTKLKDEQKKLIRQLIETKSALERRILENDERNDNGNMEEDGEEEEEMDDEKLMEITGAQGELFQVVDKNSLDELFIKRIFQQPLAESSFNDINEQNNSLINPERLKALFNERDSKIKESIEIINHWNQKEIELRDLRKVNDASMKKNREIWSTIYVAVHREVSRSRKKQNKSKTLNIEKDIINEEDLIQQKQTLSNKNNLLLNVLQDLILESGVNWSTDIELRKIMCWNNGEPEQLDELGLNEIESNET